MHSNLISLLQIASGVSNSPRNISANFSAPAEIGVFRLLRSNQLSMQKEIVKLNLKFRMSYKVSVCSGLNLVKVNDNRKWGKLCEVLFRTEQ